MGHGRHQTCTSYVTAPPVTPPITPVPHEDTFYAETRTGWGEAISLIYGTARLALTGNTSIVSLWVGQSLELGLYYIDRTYFYFDTSPIPAGAIITAARLELFCYLDFSNTDFLITIQNGQPARPSEPILLAADYNQAYYAGNGGELTTAGGLVDWVTLSLNPTGIGWITKAGTTKLCLRSSRDINGNAPVGEEYVGFANHEGGPYPIPKLIVNYTT